MARDYKHAGTRRGGKGGTAFTGWVGLTIGLTLGVALAAGVHLYHTHPARTAADTADEPQSAADAAAADTPVRRPRFDFYRMLPNYEVVIPEEDIAVAPTQDEPRVAVAGNYVLQAGSFRDPADADRLRAELALLGIESRVQTVTIDDADSWHRVRIGPLRDLDELNRIRARLAQGGVEPLLIRVGD